MTLLELSAQYEAAAVPLRQRLSGQVCVFAGNSGVGKSSILNGIDPTLVLPTGEIRRY